MTTATVLRTHRRSRPQWLGAFGYLLGSYVSMLTFWFWAIVLPVTAAVVFIVGRNVDRVEMSGVAFSHHGALWFPFSIAVILAVTYLPIHVANGMTRRSFTQAALAVNLLVGVLNGVIATLALLVERQIYHSLGWFHGGSNGEDLELFHGGVLSYGFGLVILFFAGQISGSLIGITYYRFGGWVGTLCLPLGLLPLAATGLLGLGQGVQWNPWGWTADIAPLGTIAALLILVAAAGAFWFLARDVAIDTKDSS